MQDHIEAHLDAPITLQALARAARYSPWHAARLFSEVTGKAPFEYIRLRRLSMAAELLRTSRRRVVDVAFDFVFDSHEGFSRAFSRHFGVSPRRFRQGYSSNEPFLPPQARQWYQRRQRGQPTMAKNEKNEKSEKSEKNEKTQKDEHSADPATSNTQTVFVQLMERPARKLVLKRGRAATHYFAYCEEVGCDVWEQLGAIEPALHEPMGLWLPAALRAPNTSTYVQGVELSADYSGEVPEGFDLIELAPCKMMVFQGPPFDDREFEQAITSLWDVINSYRPETYGFAWADDDAPRFQLRPEGYRGYIEGRPVRALG
jgi:AraC family transcriptional regulator